MDMSDGSTKERRWLRGPRLGTVLGAVALFLALEGHAFALPGLNSVDSGDIVNGQVRSADVGPVRRVNGTPMNIGPGLSATATAACPPGSRVMSVGYQRNGSEVTVGNIDIVGNQARVTGFNDSAGVLQLVARAFCLAP
jgi:hypothetical protein